MRRRSRRTGYLEFHGKVLEELHPELSVIPAQRGHVVSSGPHVVIIMVIVIVIAILIFVVIIMVIVIDNVNVIVIVVILRPTCSAGPSPSWSRCPHTSTSRPRHSSPLAWRTSGRQRTTGRRMSARRRTGGTRRMPRKMTVPDPSTRSCPPRGN